MRGLHFFSNSISDADAESDQLPLEIDDIPASPISLTASQNDKECPIGKTSLSHHWKKQLKWQCVCRWEQNTGQET